MFRRRRKQSSSIPETPGIDKDQTKRHRLIKDKYVENGKKKKEDVPATKEYVPTTEEEEEQVSSFPMEEDIPQVRDIFHQDLRGQSPSIPHVSLAQDGRNPVSFSTDLFDISDPPSRDAMGALVEKEEDYEMVMVGTGVNRGLKRKKRKKPEKKVFKLTPSPCPDYSVHSEIQQAISFHPSSREEAHPTGRRTLVGVSRITDYDTMEFPQDDAFSYSGRDHRKEGEESSSKRLSFPIPRASSADEELWSSSSGEDVEEAIHRISHGSGSMSALMADGSEPKGIFLGPSRDVSNGGDDDGRGSRNPERVSRKGKRGRKSEGLDIRRVPFERVAFAEDLLKQVETYQEIHGFITPADSTLGKDSTMMMMIQESPIQSEMMLTTNQGGTSDGKEISKGIPVVSPLTRIRQMFIKASRLPEEAAVIARAKELDNIQASIRFGNLNESQIHVHSNIRDYVQSGVSGRTAAERTERRYLDEDSMETIPESHEGTVSMDDPSLYDDDDVDDSYRHRGRDFGETYNPMTDQQPPSLVLVSSMSEVDEDASWSQGYSGLDKGKERVSEDGRSRKYSVLSLDVDTSSHYPDMTTTEGDVWTQEGDDDILARGGDVSQGDRDMREGFVPRHDEEEEKNRKNILTEKMNDMTRKMVMHEKNVKKIISDDTLDGLNTVMMKGTVLDVFMFDILECIRRRSSESVVLSNGKILRGGSESDTFADASSLRMAPAKSVIWKEKDIFSLCSQLVSLQRERNLYRKKVMGISGLWDDMTQSDKRAVLGDPCDVSYCGRYFRPPVGFERPCMWETECACYLIGQSNIFPDTLDRVASDTSFIGREFYTPDEEMKLKNRSWPKERRACLLCYDMATLYAYYYYKRNDQSAPFLLQNHWNKTEGENAYSPALCFPLIDNDNRWTGFIAPKVMRILTSLRPYETNVHVNGTMKTVPCFVEACQDFWLASTALAGSTRSEITGK